MEMKTKLWLWAPAFLWAALLFFLSSIPDIPTPDALPKMSDKAAHVIAYIPLGFFIIRALIRGQAKGSDQKLSIWAQGLGSLYGISDEIHQYFVPGRMADVFDAGADAVGIFIGVSLFFVLKSLGFRFV